MTAAPFLAGRALSASSLDPTRISTAELISGYVRSSQRTGEGLTLADAIVARGRDGQPGAPIYNGGVINWAGPKRVVVSIGNSNGELVCSELFGYQGSPYVSGVFTTADAVTGRPATASDVLFVNGCKSKKGSLEWSNPSHACWSNLKSQLKNYKVGPVTGATCYPEVCVVMVWLTAVTPGTYGYTTAAQVGAVLTNVRALFPNALVTFHTMDYTGYAIGANQLAPIVSVAAEDRLYGTLAGDSSQTPTGMWFDFKSGLSNSESHAIALSGDAAGYRPNPETTSTSFPDGFFVRPGDKQSDAIHPEDPDGAYRIAVNVAERTYADAVFSLLFS
jgi:hypothetical protein